VLQISGIEGDHDSGELAFADALAIMLNARVRCILYTSANYVPGTKERWRILVPLSKNYPPEWREKGVARINGLLGGHLAGESFTLSLSYLYGHLKGTEYRVEVIDGRFLDLCDDLYAGSIFKDGSGVGGQGANGNGHDFNDAGPQHRSRKDDDPEPDHEVEAALNVISSNCSYEVWLKVAAALWHELGEHGFELFDRWSAKATGTVIDENGKPQPRYTPAKSQERWRGARTMHSIAGATIFYYADQADPAWRQRYDADRVQRMFARMAAGAGASNGSYSDEFGQQAKSPGIPLDYYEDFGKAVAKKAIIKGVIFKGERSSWIGPPGSGKSALLTNIMIHVAGGGDWRGYRSKERVGVVYFALERSQLVKRRLMAHRSQEINPPTLPIAVASKAINLLSPDCVTTIVETVRTAETHFGCPVGMIIIDTFNKGIAMGGGDEDKARDQNIAAANLQQVQNALTDIHVALIGHTGKDESRGARGSNAHLGDVDMMVQISVADSARTATITKINDGMEGVLTQFKLKPVTLGQDEDGDPITTAIVDDELLDGEKEKSRAKLSNTQRRAMELLERCIIEQGKPVTNNRQFPKGVITVPTDKWRETCILGDLSAGSAQSTDRVFRRAMSDLLSMHRIGTGDGLVWIAYE
jgi:hypothetical protein